MLFPGFREHLESLKLDHKRKGKTSKIETLTAKGATGIGRQVHPAPRRMFFSGTKKEEMLASLHFFLT